MKYVIEYNEIKCLSIREAKKHILNCDGIRLDEMKVKDLTYHNDEFIYPGSGVYIFRNGKQIVYVGKCSSMSFTERIAKHFDLRKVAWMNRLLKLICERIQGNKVTDDNLKIASKYAFENLSLVLINFKERDRIDRTERMFRATYKEALNTFKKLKIRDESVVVELY
ncbi:MAG: hypothetical protein JKY53_12410 [Flavobacteriales bacterium]|nr:hypothetical protein [Flavobacteriales bacterium]